MNVFKKCIPAYSESDWATTGTPFHVQLLRERELQGWSQADLAEKLGCDLKTVNRWENGRGFPRPHYRRELCKLFRKNAQELGLVKETTLQPPVLKERSVDEFTGAQKNRSDIPQVTHLPGRDKECTRLVHWIKEDHCQIVAILGMGGIGKTAVARQVVADIKQTFEYVFWCPLEDQPPLESWLKQCLIAHQQGLDLPEVTHELIALFIQYLRDHSCLLVLDGFESILQPGRPVGCYREEYAAYGRLLQQVGETQHSSCLLLTSREKPKEVALLEGKSGPVRYLRLSGLPLEAGEHLLRNKGLIGSEVHQQTLIKRYSGNPLALQAVSALIQEVFGGDIARFLEEKIIVVGAVYELLAQQFHRLTAPEKEIMYRLAIEREALSLESLRQKLAHRVSTGYLEALASLRRRSLLETREPGKFTLQPALKEYVTMKLIEQTKL
jgi:transcriptional regulator with XRE-family HTH domain